MRMVYREEDIYCFFFNDTATTEIYTLSLHDALPILAAIAVSGCGSSAKRQDEDEPKGDFPVEVEYTSFPSRSEEHTSELQSRQYLVCRLLLEKKNNKISPSFHTPPLHRFSRHFSSAS